MDVKEMDKLIEAVEGGLGIVNTPVFDDMDKWVWEAYVNAMEGSMDAAKALHDALLPGWWWRIGTCRLSDDACVSPHDDSRAPDGGEWSDWTDIDQRPSGNPARAWLLAILKAYRAQVSAQ